MTLGVPSGEKDEITFYSCNGNPHQSLAEVAKLLQIPLHKLTLKLKRIGGSFGGKARLLTLLITGMAVKKFRRPCRYVVIIVNTIKEEQLELCL